MTKKKIRLKKVNLNLVDIVPVNFGQENKARDNKILKKKATYCEIILEQKLKNNNSITSARFHQSVVFLYRLSTEKLVFLLNLVFFFFPI